MTPRDPRDLLASLLRACAGRYITPDGALAEYHRAVTAH